ncbi:imelysin family protein [Aliiroseovarius sp. 2305UL8-7]|uniref:imelysin family protein n=1 Tax=Aliiroseovarius conchicola TaxID=3121637 RepID=UPI003528AE2C
MKFVITIVAATLLPTLVHSATPDPKVDHTAVADRILAVLDDQFATFRDEAAVLADQSQAFCAGETPRSAVDAALASTWIAWAPLDAYQFGPIEAQSAALAVNFFPDKKNFVGRALKGLLKRPNAEQADPKIVAASSVGSQGLPAIERLLYDDLQTCPALVGVSGNLARIGVDLYDGWFAPGGWGDLVRNAGPENPVYLSHQEFTRQIFTALDFSILRLKQHRIGRPLGTYERSFPKSAEAWRSGLTNDIMLAQLQGISDIVDRGFAGAIFNPSRAWIVKVVADTQARVNAIGAPLAEAMGDPIKRVRAEGLQTKLDFLQLQLDQDIGPGLDVETGFSAGDGD